VKIIILHGWGHNGDLWTQLANKLGKDALAIDMPGFGKEPLVRDYWGVPDYAKWAEKKISKYKNVVLIGHSFGGRVSAEIASKNPKYLKGLILSGAPCIYRPTLAIQLRIKIYKLFKFLIPQEYRNLFYSGDLKKAGELEKIFRKVINYDQTKQLQRINLPTLLIWGENDEQVPLRIAQEINILIQVSQLQIIENTGHNAFMESPNLFYAYVKKFISSL
jgi:pimeloyl-ACP methyl ester carboxylesterase